MIFQNLFRRHSEEERTLSRAKRIALGAGGVPQEPGWLGTDRAILDITERQSFARLWRPGTRERFVAEHVWEHLTLEDARRATVNCFEFLRSKGILRLAVPDGNFPDEGYIEYVRPGGSGPGADDHKILWTADTLENLLSDAGFKARRIEWWDSDGVFHFEPWSREDGYIDRSREFDERNSDGQLRFTSLIVDGVKR